MRGSFGRIATTVASGMATRNDVEISSTVFEHHNTENIANAIRIQLVIAFFCELSFLPR